MPRIVGWQPWSCARCVAYPLPPIKQFLMVDEHAKRGVDKIAATCYVATA